MNYDMVFGKITVSSIIIYGENCKGMMYTYIHISK